MKTPKYEKTISTRLELIEAIKNYGGLIPGRFIKNCEDNNLQVFEGNFQLTEDSTRTPSEIVIFEQLAGKEAAAREISELDILRESVSLLLYSSD